MIITESSGYGDECRSLLCDSNGIIIAEMAYRCTVCGHISDSIADGQDHYSRRHMRSECQEDESADDGDQGSTPRTSNASGTEVPVDSDFDADINFSDREEDFDFSSSLSHASSQKVIDSDPASQATSQQKGGFVTCAVCHMTKYYQSVQRRYGQFTCMGCAKFFGRFLIKPKHYSCPDLGSCPLQVTPRCKACLLHACIRTYVMDEKRSAIAQANRPVRTSAPAVTPHSARRLPASKTVPTLTSGRNKNNGHRTQRSGNKQSRGCRQCAGCLLQDCGSCMHCKDKPKFGGSNTLKQKCMNRRCILSDKSSTRSQSQADQQPLQPLLLQSTA